MSGGSPKLNLGQPAMHLPAGGLLTLDLDCISHPTGFSSLPYGSLGVVGRTEMWSRLGLVLRKHRGPCDPVKALNLQDALKQLCLQVRNLGPP